MSTPEQQLESMLKNSELPHLHLGLGPLALLLGAAISLSISPTLASPETSPAASRPQAGEKASIPTAATLVYTSGASGNADLWLRNSDGTEKQLTHHPAQDHWASWSPDGRTIAFQSTRDGQREIYVMSADGTGVRNLTNHPAQDLLPAISPEGGEVLFYSDRGLEHGPRELPGHLYVVGIDGQNLRQLTTEPLSSTFAGAWSPDGNSILFARNFDGDIDLVLLDLKSRRENRLPGTDAAEYGGQFSPDGKSIALHASGEGAESRIVVLDRDGGNRRSLTSGAQHYDPRWSPDGRWILFTSAPLNSNQYDLLLVNAEGGEPQPLIASPVDERTGSFSPGPPP